jgi:hypothetical protein
MRFTEGKKYQVFWQDITTDNTWMTLKQVFEEVDKMKPCVNTWTYMGSRGSWRIFTSGMNQDGQLYDYHLIPKTVIIKVKLLR